MNEKKNGSPSADDRIDELMRDYHEVESPLTDARRDQMWQAISERRHGVERPVPRVVPSPRWRRMLWPVAAAALLLLGVGIGRNLSFDRTGAPAVVESDEPPAGRERGTVEAFYRLAARDYLRRTETQLVRFRQDSVPPLGSTEAPMTDWAAGLLVQTRLLLGSPAAEDPAFRALLEDLEVVLARLVQVSADTPELDQDWILEGLERQDILRRLRRELPPETTNPQPAVRT